MQLVDIHVNAQYRSVYLCEALVDLVSLFNADIHIMMYSL